MLLRWRKQAFLVLLFSSGLFCFFLQYSDFHTVCANWHMPKIGTKMESTRFQHWLSQLKNFSSPEGLIVNTIWQVVVEKQTYVLSAFYDPRDKPYGAIRIMAITSTYMYWQQPALYCHLWYGESNITISDVPVTVRARVDIIKEAHNKRYGPEILTCPLASYRQPEYVSISSSNCQQEGNLLPIKYPEQQPNHTFTVCTAPLKHNYSDIYQLVEFIESNRIFGAEQFVLYDYDTGPLLYPYLKAYLQEGIIQIVQWPELLVYINGTGSSRQIHNYGQVVALTDCVYRHMFDSRYIAYMDLDEMIVPRDGHSWQTLIEEVNHQNSFFDRIHTYIPFLPRIHFGAFSFRNRFFLSKELAAKRHLSEPSVLEQFNISSDVSSLITKYHIKSLALTIASSRHYPHGVRSKYIVHPPDVLLPGIHLIFQFYSSDTKTFNFEADSAMLHHYRHVLPESGAEVNNEFAALHYLDVLLPRIVSRHRSIEDEFDKIN